MAGWTRRRSTTKRSTTRPAAPVLQRALSGVTPATSVALVDMHGVPLMDSGGLLLVLDLHRRAECLGLRVLVVGRQAQPQRLLAAVAGIPGPGSATGARFAPADFRRLIEQRAERQPELGAAAERPYAEQACVE
ncbi:STAS domain-containing protein [Streptomyces sp. NPDC058664]|uniref:STAS domain-containing protein n=1 Tax=unclassified Streptomyces TaxID=2593676 RepID=UPI00365E05B4